MVKKQTKEMAHLTRLVELQAKMERDLATLQEKLDSQSHGEQARTEKLSQDLQALHDQMELVTEQIQ